MVEPQICPNCHSMNPTTNLVCQVCGASLSAPTSSRPPRLPVKSTNTSLPPLPSTKAIAPPSLPPSISVKPHSPPPIHPAAHSIHKLGIKVDEFSDIMIDDAPAAARLTQIFIKAVMNRGIPQVQVSEGEFSVEGKTRRCQIIKGPEKTTFLASITPYGKDLILGWEMYIKRTLRWISLVIMAGVAIILPLLSVLFASLTYGGLITFAAYWTNFFQFLFYTVLAGLLLGKIFKDDWLHFFVEDTDEITWSEAMSLQLVVHEALLETMETIDMDSPKLNLKGASKPPRKTTPQPKPKGKKLNQQ
jgi:hypothetical protein